MSIETTIEINSMRIFARHGVLPQERTVGNEFEVTVHLRYPADPSTDNILDTVNYAEIIEVIRKEMDEPADLIEKVAWRIREQLIARWPDTGGGLVRICKLHPPVAGVQLTSAAVKLTW